MLTPAALLLGVALLCWPHTVAGLRLASISTSNAVTPGAGTSISGRGARLRALALYRRCVSSRGPVLLPAALVVLLVAVFAGPVCAAGPALLIHAGWRQWAVRARARAAVVANRHAAEALRILVGELRAGVHPAMAAEAAARDAAADTAAAMRSIAASARLGGELVLQRNGARPDTPADRVATRLATAWSLARRHGLPMADVLDSVRRDIDATAVFAEQGQARMAGPRSSALVLALLPVVGVGLGEAMGARPVAVLTATGAGNLLLLLGCLLLWAGVLWSGWLTGRAVPR